MKRILTVPSTGCYNDGHDNANFDLILTVDDTLINSNSQIYVVKGFLGRGSFGQVAKCWSPDRNAFVAIKILKNRATIDLANSDEVTILAALNSNHDPDDSHHIVRMYDHFIHHRHLCICFELLGVDLHEHTKLTGLPLDIVKLFSKQILRCLSLLKATGIIHCDLKPANILLCRDPQKLKVIDFGSAMREHDAKRRYNIQTQGYRSPEVLLWCPYTAAIDMWSYGCVVAELFLGFSLFQGASEFEVLRRMMRILGSQPPDHLLLKGGHTLKFFKRDGLYEVGKRSCFKVLSNKEYETRNQEILRFDNRRYGSMSLEDIVESHPYRVGISADEFAVEFEIRLALIDFLRGLLEFDPRKRLSPFQASKHPFLTGERFDPPLTRETSAKRVADDVNVDYNYQRGADRFAAGRSRKVNFFTHFESRDRGRQSVSQVSKYRTEGQPGGQPSTFAGNSSPSQQYRHSRPFSGVIRSSYSHYVRSPSPPKQNNDLLLQRNQSREIGRGSPSSRFNNRFRPTRGGRGRVWVSPRDGSPDTSDPSKNETST